MHMISNIQSKDCYEFSLEKPTQSMDKKLLIEQFDQGLKVSVQENNRVHQVKKYLIEGLPKTDLVPREFFDSCYAKVVGLGSESKVYFAQSLKGGMQSEEDIAFGKAKWEKYFGDIGVEPPLPQNIEEILNNPCPFWSGKKVRNTHLLVLVPETVNGKTFCLDSLSELIQSPKTGFKTKYSYYNDYLKKEIGTQSMKSHWALMTRDVIPESRNKTYDDQKALVAKHAQESGIPYELPKALEAVTAILMHHVETGEALYTDGKLGEQYTYTRCQEKVNNNQWPAGIGSFSSGGLFVDDFCYDRVWCGDAFGGVGCVRKF